MVVMWLNESVLCGLCARGSLKDYSLLGIRG